MTDKERIEQIRKKSFFKTGSEKEFIRATDVIWLIEQAERALKNADDLEIMDKQLASEQKRILKLQQRVHILEQRNKRISDSAIDLLAENRFYQKVIKKALHEVRYGYSDIAEEILLEALGGESNECK